MNAMEGRAMVWHVEGRLCVVVHDVNEPTDNEWHHYLESMRTTPRVKELCVLIRSMGGGPTGVQRQRLQQRVGKYPPPVAILAAPTTAMRGIGTALRWFNGHVGVFEPTQLEAACDHLGLSKFERAAAAMCLARLERELSFGGTHARA
jgi:hypothetical protein